MLIKNKYLIEKIENANGTFLDLLLLDAPDDLASIFLRDKHLLLAMKKTTKNRTFFNQLRRKTKNMHVPMPQDYLSNVTSLIRNNALDIDILSEKLKSANLFRKIMFSLRT